MSGDLLSGASYAESISRNASMNPWCPAEDTFNYAEAARMLRAEHENKQRERALEALYA